MINDEPKSPLLLNMVLVKHIAHFLLMFPGNVRSFLLSLLITVGVFFQSYAQQTLQQDPLHHDMDRWVDSVLNTLSFDQKIGQLFMTRLYSNKNEVYEEEMRNVIRSLHVGGMVVAQGGPVRQVRLLNEFQKLSRIPMLIGTDGEWGLGMRLDTTISFPYQMTLGAIEDNQLIYRMGEEIARQLRMMGIHINFAPVADVNNNPANPVIGYRSFGEDKVNVTAKTIAYMKGMQDHGVLATAKHFPGHGDTDTDSHLALPFITQSKERIDSLELYPFKRLINEGVGCIMVAHLNIPALDATKNLPSTLSQPVVTGLLKEKLGFKGLTITDAMTMKGVAEHYSQGESAVKAVLAGNDIILLPENLEPAIEGIKAAVNKKQIPLAMLDERCRKILAFKYMMGLSAVPKLDTANIIERLNTPAANLLNRQLLEASVTLLKNDGAPLPLRRLDTLAVASLSVGRDTLSAFQHMLSNYTNVSHFTLSAEASAEQISAIRSALKKYNLVVVGVHEVSGRPRLSPGYNDEVTAFVNELSQQHNTLLSFFRNAYAINAFAEKIEAPVCITTYEDSDLAEEIAAQIIFGALGAKGKLPVTINEQFQAGTGVATAGGLRLKYTLPEEVGIDSEKLTERLKAIITEGIQAGAFPGCQLLIAKDSKVIYHNSFGFQAYDSLKPVHIDDLYDFASVTKVTGPLPALMKLHDGGKFDLDAPMKAYWPDFKHSNKGKLTWRNVLAHNARLKAWIAYWTTTRKKNGKYKRHTLSPDSSASYPVRITGKLYEHEDYKKKIYKAIKKSPLNKEKGYVYSGLTFYLYPQIIENMTKEDYETYVKKNFYGPLGATSLTYNPLRYYTLDHIIPTERDTFFRMEQIHGTVHDEGAIMMGGVSGNAGLFGNSNDLAKLIQMYANLGSYGGKEYITNATFSQFITCQYCEEQNHRGLGFDKPLLERKERGYVAADASMRSFGHSGYTGTMVWADPENNLIFIFLSNRVYPTRASRSLYDLNIRPRLHQTVYDLLMR